MKLMSMGCDSHLQPPTQELDPLTILYSMEFDMYFGVSHFCSEWLMSESEKLSTRVTTSQAPYLPVETWQDSGDLEVEGGGLKDQKKTKT
jgi:hypothetical protein